MEEENSLCWSLLNLNKCFGMLLLQSLSWSPGPGLSPSGGGSHSRWAGLCVRHGQTGAGGVRHPAQTPAAGPAGDLRHSSQPPADERTGQTSAQGSPSDPGPPRPAWCWTRTEAFRPSGGHLRGVSLWFWKLLECVVSTLLTPVEFMTPQHVATSALSTQ